MVTKLASRPSCPGFNSQHSDFLFQRIKLLIAEVNQQYCLEESGQWLESVYGTHQILASGKLVRKKVYFSCLFEISSEKYFWVVFFSPKLISLISSSSLFHPFSVFRCSGGFRNPPLPTFSRIFGSRASFLPPRSLSLSHSLTLALSLSLFLLLARMGAA